MRYLFTMWAMLLALVISLSACGAGGDQLGANLSGNPVKHDMGDGVTCYTYTQGSLSCVKVK